MEMVRNTVLFAVKSNDLSGGFCGGDRDQFVRYETMLFKHGKHLSAYQSGSSDHCDLHLEEFIFRMQKYATKVYPPALPFAVWAD
jgi:hypothetical protein